jgi:hypothetical protein
VNQLTGLTSQCSWRNPARYPAPPRATVVAVATTYLQALVSHKANHVLVAPDVCRMENGLNSARSDSDIRRGIETPALGGIRGISGVRWFVEGPEGVAYYTLDATTSIEYIAERFLVINGRIQEIEADFAAPGFPPGVRK